MEKIEFYTDADIAKLLGVRAGTVRKWRVRNKQAGNRRLGPPYEFYGHRVVYPKAGFEAWVTGTTEQDGVVRHNRPPTAAPDAEVAAEVLVATKGDPELTVDPPAKPTPDVPARTRRAKKTQPAAAIPAEALGELEALSGAST